jgi:hypothetical protein
MTTSPSVSYLAPQFDDFLFARIEEDSDAAPLSVPSVLSRLGIDPWEEAAKLTRLERVPAAKRLAAFIAATPGASPIYLNTKTVCDRLIDLLPSPAEIAIWPGKERGVRPLTKSRFLVWAVAIAVVAVIPWIVLSHQ